MTTYYVGKGGSDVADGLSWANRLLTLNAAEDIPVAPADIVYVGPGVYRESLTLDVDGTAGNQISYVGDITGENTDGIGGVVRITGSNDDQSAVRDHCIEALNDNYRTFRGFVFDTSLNICIEGNSCTNWIIEDCTILYSGDISSIGSDEATQNDWIVRRCLIGMASNGVSFSAPSDQSDVGHLVENCLFIGCSSNAVRLGNIGGCTVKNCTFIANEDGVDVFGTAGTGAGQFTTVENCIFVAHRDAALEGVVTGDIVEDYNTFYANSIDRTNTATGGNSLTYPPLFAMPILVDGFRLIPNVLGELSPDSQLVAIAGNSESTDDFFGMTKPATSSKRSWGAFQFVDVNRETGTVDAGSVSLNLADAGRVQFIVPTTAVSTTISVKVYRETNYAGTAPQMVIKQPSQADRTMTDAGSASAWNTLTDTFTPSGTTDFVVVELVSNNTATSGNYDVFFDTINVN